MYGLKYILNRIFQRRCCFGRVASVRGGGGWGTGLQHSVAHIKKNTTKCIQLFKWWEPKISINNHLYVQFDFYCFHFYSDDRTVHLKK